jgi:uncharacterized membrane protein YcaP (DUF421 family)
MSSFDFAITTVTGSVITSTVLNEKPSLFEGTVALAALYLCQRVISWARIHMSASQLVDNAPILLMVRDTIFEEALKETRFTKEDIYSKLRQANVLDFDDIHAVVLETTGDIAVIHSSSDKLLNPTLLEGVRIVNSEISPVDSYYSST